MGDIVGDVIVSLSIASFSLAGYFPFDSVAMSDPGTGFFPCGGFFPGLGFTNVEPPVLVGASDGTNVGVSLPALQEGDHMAVSVQ